MSEQITRKRLGEGGQDLSDRARVDTMTEEELIEAIKNDPDTEELPPDWRERAMLYRPGQPGVPYRSEHPKQLVTLRLDPDLLDRFRKQGPGYEARINDASATTTSVTWKRTRRSSCSLVRRQARWPAGQGWS